MAGLVPAIHVLLVRSPPTPVIPAKAGIQRFRLWLGLMVRSAAKLRDPQDEGGERRIPQYSALTLPHRRSYILAMNAKVKIEVDAQTADLLEARASARGMSVGDLVADLAADNDLLPQELEAMRLAGEGPWAPEILAEDRRRLDEFHRTGEGIPWDDVKAWMQSWGTSEELPRPKPRKL